MVRPSKNEKANPNPSNPELIERNRLKTLAFSKSILSETAAKSHTQLTPSKAVLKHHGKDIIKKSQRKNRYLFSFPGLIAPVGGGKIGELKNLGTKNPILYLDFPQGQMKLFGTIMYPKNKYLTMQFSRGGKNVMCEDYFDNMIVFTDAWWIGRRDENPEEARLEFPKELTERPDVDCDFRAGVGATVIDKPSGYKPGRKLAEEPPETETDDDLSDAIDDLKKPKEMTPVRQSERNAGKRFRFVEASSGDSVGSDEDVEEERDGQKCDSTATGSSMDDGNGDDLELARKVQDSSRAAVKSKNPVSSTIVPEEPSTGNQGSLVQATISTLFKKVEKKKDPEVKKSPLAKGSPRKRNTALKKGVTHDERPANKRKAVRDKSAGKEKVAKGKEAEKEIDPIEVSSSTSKDTDGSDEEWAA